MPRVGVEPTPLLTGLIAPAGHVLLRLLSLGFDPENALFSSVIPLDSLGLFVDADVSRDEHHEGRLPLLSTLTTLSCLEEN